MFWITGGGVIIYALHQTLAGPATNLLDVECEQVRWTGFHFYNLVFSFFLFIVGVALPFSLIKCLEAGANRRELYRHIVTRLVALLNGFLGGACAVLNL